MSLLDEIAARLLALPEDQRNAVAKEAMAATAHLPYWVPNPGPQTDAFFCEADELFYGGEAGGGKTDLLLGTCLSAHAKGLILRRLNGEVDGLIERMTQIVGHTRGLKRSSPIRWRLPGKLILFSGCQYENDWTKHQGDPKDFIGFDEVPNFLEMQYRSIVAWNRSVKKGQRVRVIATGNPPKTPEGMWVTRYWGPWLDPNHARPALPGELRWYTTIDGVDTMVDGPGEVTLPDGSILRDKHGKPILPKSRTFIPAELADNPDLEESGYGHRLAALPSEMRRAMFEGDFAAGLEDAPDQTIPGEWIDAAFARWNENGRNSPMTVLAGDLAEARDRSVLQPRHGSWFDKQLVKPGKETPDGPTTAGWIVTVRRNRAEVIIDMGGGYGGSTRDHLRHSGIDPTLYNGAKSAEGFRDKTGTLKFRNIRALAYWRLRDALDPTYGSTLAIYPDYDLKAELIAHKHFNGIGGIQILDKDEIKDVLGRSPDKADALVMAHYATGMTWIDEDGRSTLPKRANLSSRRPPRR